jgi:hypothetical protein
MLRRINPAVPIFMAWHFAAVREELCQASLDDAVDQSSNSSSGQDIGVVHLVFAKIADLLRDQPGTEMGQRALTRFNQEVS